MKNSASYLVTIDGNKDIEDAKKLLFRLAPDFVNAIEKDAARIAELEAQNKRLVEALGDTNAALIVTANDLSRHGGYAGENAYKIVTNARALLAELTA